MTDKAMATTEGVHHQPTIIEIIARAAQDPTVDVDKLERLLQMGRQVRADDAKAAYIQALVKMKPLLPVIDRKGRIVIHEKGKEKVAANIVQDTAFARWEDIDAAITHRSGTATDGKIEITAVLSHVAGHSEETTMALPHDSSGSKNPVQAVGSTTSYGKRYTASLLLNIRTKGEDDDGRLGGMEGPIDETQIANLQDLLDKSESDIEKFCKYMGVEFLKEIPAKQYGRALEALNLALNAHQKKKAAK